MCPEPCALGCGNGEAGLADADGADTICRDPAFDKRCFNMLLGKPDVIDVGTDRVGVAHDVEFDRFAASFRDNRVKLLADLDADPGLIAPEFNTVVHWRSGHCGGWDRDRFWRFNGGDARRFQSVTELERHKSATDVEAQAPFVGIDAQHHIVSAVFEVGLTTAVAQDCGTANGAVFTR